MLPCVPGGAQAGRARCSAGVDQGGKAVDAGDPTAVVESVKAASDIYAPLAGTIVEVNPGVEADPSLVNTDPYSSGWIFKIQVKDIEHYYKLMDAAAYKTHIS